MESHFEDLIVSEQFAKLGNKTVVCLLILKNGFEVVGSANCINPDNFDMEIGKKHARNDAREKVETFWAYSQHA